MKKNKIAIACQGGGSQTAFTAGVLKSILMNGIQEEKKIVSLSGTSGGAVCATLSWYSLLRAAKGDTTPLEERLCGFWRDNSTQNLLEELFNAGIIQSLRMIERGMIPEWKSSPDSYVSKFMTTFSEAMLPRQSFYDFRGLLEKYIDFEEIAGLVEDDSPVLLVGAANVLSGEFKKFNSRKGEIRVEALLASAAVPTIFPAVMIGEDAYWDGLFSDNPPTDELLNPDIVGMERFPDELWVVQINPKTCREVPKTPGEVLDRRNEMIGNESLFQDLRTICLINKFIEKKVFKQELIEKYEIKPVKTFVIQMSPDLLDSLDYSTKLNRKAEFIERLIADGERQGNRFLEAPEDSRYSCEKHFSDLLTSL